MLNPGFLDGYSTKPLMSFAAGGFLLVDRKRHFVDEFGDAGEAVSYDGPDDLAAKVDLFLGDPRYRRETGDAIRERIAARYGLPYVLARLIHATAERATRAAARRVPKPPASAVLRVKVAADLLSGWHSEPQWSGARTVPAPEGILVVTPAKPWVYAAMLPLPPGIRAMNQPHLCLTAMVTTGRVGVAALREQDGTLDAEQLLSPNARPVTVKVELPREGCQSIILRNAAEGESCVLLLATELCDRAR